MYIFGPCTVLLARRAGRAHQALQRCDTPPRAASLGPAGANGQGGAGGQVVVLQQETYADYYLQAKGGAGAEQNLTAKLGAQQ